MLLSVGAFGCERRTDEPVSTAPPSLATGVRPQPGPTATDSRLQGRCIQPLPAEPSRIARVGPDPACPEDPEPQRVGALRLGTVRFVDVGLTLAVELAEKEDDRARGLMYRRHLRDDQGMLFVFEESRIQRFWMENTCVSLDMLFIDGDGLIVGIDENAPTLNRGTRAVGCPSRYVLEVAAGWSRRNNVKPGQFVRFDGL